VGVEQFAEWERKLGVRRSVVLFVTLWMTWAAFAWAKEYATALIAVNGGNDMLVAAAALIAAVTAPITALQVAVFNAYIRSKGDNTE
jgi:hypothetical protein